MTLTVAHIDALVAAGCTVEQLAALVKADIAASASKADIKRAKDAERQRKKRAAEKAAQEAQKPASVLSRGVTRSHAESRGVTRTSRDTKTKKEKTPQTPQKEKNKNILIPKEKEPLKGFQKERVLPEESGGKITPVAGQKQAEAAGNGGILPDEPMAKPNPRGQRLPEKWENEQQTDGDSQLITGGIAEVVAKAEVTGTEPDDCVIAVAMWQVFAEKVGVPQIRGLTPERRKKLKFRLSEFGLDSWREALQRAVDSEYLGHDPPPWLNFNFLIKNQENFLKLLEGNYDKSFANERTKPSGKTRGQSVLEAVQAKLAGGAGQNRSGDATMRPIRDIGRNKSLSDLGSARPHHAGTA